MQLNDFLKDVSERLTNALPENIKTAKKDLEKNTQAILKSAFSKLDLVTREEFDTQTKVLARTRKKIEILEEKIKALEDIIHNKPGV
jgi:BMFP domain-containing protein YqiC